MCLHSSLEWICNAAAPFLNYLGCSCQAGQLVGLLGMPVLKGGVSRQERVIVMWLVRPLTIKEFDIDQACGMLGRVIDGVSAQQS